MSGHHIMITGKDTGIRQINGVVSNLLYAEQQRCTITSNGIQVYSAPRIITVLTLERVMAF